MNPNENKFWPYRPRKSITLSIFLLIIFTFLLRSTFGWPSKDSEKTVLIFVLVLSLLPLILALIDMIIEKGIPIEVYGIKIDFSKVEQMGLSDFKVPYNIAVPGEPVNDSGTMEILKELRQAVKNDISIIDLEEGRSWWETRLLILVAGAERLGRPKKIVFTAGDDGKQRQFQGWARPDALLHCLVQVDPLYQRCLSVSRAAANQWKLVEPLYIPDATTNSLIPVNYDWMINKVSTSHSWMAFQNDGLPNELFAEQILANELGTHIEQLPGGKRNIDLTKLNDLFRSVLQKDIIDQNWPIVKQQESFFNSDSNYIAITRKNTYLAIDFKNSCVQRAVKKYDEA